MKHLSQFAICILQFAICNSLLPAADPWHLDGWAERAVVEIGELSADKTCDAAGVKVLCQGQAMPDGSDYRIVDANGKPVPFLLAYHDAATYSLLTFQCVGARTGDRYFVYYGKPGAETPAGMNPAARPEPGGGAPVGEWAPKTGLVFATFVRPEGKNPETVEDLQKMLADSPGAMGARFQPRIADGFNPFGSSDMYLSVYRGWLRIPEAGKYQFCTASNEASFSFLDGQPLVHWPGRHTAERGLRGEKNVTLELTAGMHYVEYYHEEVFLEQVAFLGWMPPGAVAFEGIPEDRFPQPHAAHAVRYETPQGLAGLAVKFEPQVLDSIWPEIRHEGQYTRVRLRVAGDKPQSEDRKGEETADEKETVPPQPPVPSLPFPDGTMFTWNFGDGQTATGASVEHVYLTLGKFAVTVTAEFEGKTSGATWPLIVYEIQHATDQIKEGRPGDYLAAAKTYDRTKLDAAGLREITHLFAEFDAPTEALVAGKEYVARFGDQDPKSARLVRRLMAEAAIRLGEGGIDQAVENYRASLADDMPIAERLDVLARLIRLLGIESNYPEKAAEVLPLVEAAVAKARLDDPTRRAYQKALNATGEVMLWHGKRAEAIDLLKRAELLHEKAVPPQVRAARIGSYPNAIRDYLAEGNPGAALDVVNQWEESFPTEKAKGHTFFWRGKLLFLQEQNKPAARYLARAIGLAPGAEFETEARWLLAESLMRMGKPQEARQELAKLISSGLQDRFVELAKARLRAEKAK